MKILFAAYIGPVNPYFQQLRDELKKLGHIIIITPTNKYFPLLSSYFEHKDAQILHLHWLTSSWLSPVPIKSVFKSVQFWLELIILKLLGVKIVWTVHNQNHHEHFQPLLDHLNNWVVSRLVTCHIFLCPTAYAVFSQKYPVTHFYISPHSSYLEHYPNQLSQTQSRRNLHLDKTHRVFLFFGNLRPYKGIETLIHTFTRLKPTRTKLLIVGWSSPNYRRTLQSTISLNPSIILVPDRIPTSDVQLYFNSADIVVLPFLEILSSGSILLAFSFAKPVIAPAVGCVKDLLTPDGGFPYFPNDSVSLSKALTKALQTSPSELETMGQHNYHVAQTLNPVQEAEKIDKLYKSLISEL